MDFYKKINMDNFKPKLPSIKLQMPTLKSRKIFKTSKEDLSKNPNVYTINTTEHQELPRFPPATFIERTPRRISTVSSLQVQQEQSDIILEDSRVHGVYTNYENRDFEEKKSAEQNDEGLHQRFTRRYKEFQEFKFKNIFGKRTVVRKTEISMDMYADRYKEDLEVERQRRQQQQDHQNSIEYNFQFKDSKQNSRDDVTSPTTSVKSNASTLPIKEDFRKRSRKSQQKECKFKSESLDSVEEKPQVEYSQSWRFGTLRGKSINRKDSVNKRPQSIRKKSIKEKVKSEEVGTKKKWTFKKPRPVEPPPLPDQEAIPEPKKNRWTLRNSKTSSNATTDIVPSVPKKKWTLRSRPSIDDEPEKVQPDVNKKKNKKHKTRPKSKDEGSPCEEIADSSTKKKSWSMKKHMSSSVESYSSAKEEFQNSTWNFRKIKGSNLLSKWKSRTMQVLSQPNLSTVGLEGNTPERKQKITLRIWKRNKNVKKAASTDDITTGAEPKTSFFNFKYFNKKENEEQISVEEAIIDNRKLTHKERLENAKDRAKQAVNDQIQKLHFFRSQQTSKYSEDSEKGKKRKKGFDEDLDDEVAAANIEEIQNSPAAIWASEQEFNQSINTLETNDYNMNMPKVLIRQQSYENREPTLVITMTSSRLHPHISPLFRGRRLESLDSNDSDTWISNTYNNIIVEKEVIEKDSQEHERNDCKLHTLRRVESVDLRPLPRRTSVDVFHNEKPFENFDMELQDTPIISIESEIPPPPPSTSPPREESPERVVEQVSIETVVMEQHTHIVIKKKEESIEEIEEPVLEVADTNENFIQEKVPIFEGEKNEPTLEKQETVKQDVKSQNLVKPRSSFKRPSVQPPNVPERTASMVNLPRPIIKQGSLRRKLSADLESKIGKVNSLINKFENSHEDLTDSTKSSTNEMENTERPVSDLENNNTSINNESKPTKLKTIEVKRRAIAPAVPIPSPRITSEKCSVPKQSDPVANIPVIPSGNSANVKPVQAKDDENYFSLSDEENSNFYSMGNDVPVFTKQTYIFEF